MSSGNEKKCCVPNCGKTCKDNTLHQFPNPDKDQDRFRTWLYAIGGDILALDNNVIFKNRRVCHSHFGLEYHTRSGKLSANAVPTLHLPGFNITKERTPMDNTTNTCETNMGETGEAKISTAKGASTSSTIAGQNTSAIADSATTNAVTNVGLMRKIKKMQLSKNKYAAQLKKALKIAKNTSFQKALNNFTTAAFIFTMLQFREIKKHKMGRRFTKKEKIMALSLYKQGPKAYRFLRKMFVLPSPITLSRIISKASLKPGINENIFTQLEKQAKKMNSTDKLCVLLFDEIALCPHFDYNEKNDKISGFVNDGCITKKQIADHALVFMIRGVHRNYKQPICYTFCAGTTPKFDIVNLLKTIIKKLNSVGFKVLATVCDQGGTNTSAINYLINETKVKYARMGFNFEKNVFEIDNDEVVPLFDPPHLIKGIRNNLLDKDLQCVIDKKQKSAKWEHVMRLYQENPAYKGLRLMPKLTEAHVNPRCISKMKVKFATQIFSRTVATNMGYLAGRPSHPTATPPPDPAQIPPEPPPKSPFKQDDIYLEKPFLPSKPISHSPKISPSSIPNPSPSVTTTKQVEPGYPSYGGYLYSIPGYSAFQPVSYQGIMPPSQHPPQAPTDYSFSTTTKESTKEKSEVKPDEPTKVEAPKEQDFEEHFTPEIIPAVSNSDPKTTSVDSKMSITSLAQGSGSTVTIPSHTSTKEAKKKTPERFSLKTSIPISKIDMKCVSNPPDAIYQNAISKKIQAPFNPAFQNTKDNTRLEIQSNVVIKNAQKESEAKPEAPKPISNPAHPNVTHTSNNNISALLNAAETINKTDNQFWKPEAKPDSPPEVKELPTFTPQVPVTAAKTVYNPVTTECSKLSFTSKPPETSYGEQKNQILFIQNKNASNPKMLLTIQQQNPQVLLQRSNYESKNLQAPSRLTGQIKKCKEEHMNENGTSSKVVALKRLHQENCDENDFENLITENQIYGNKIVVKEKSGTVQEQDLKKNKDKPIQETKNVVLQPNFLYLSNVQFPANLMMIKNNKINQTADMKPSKTTANENKTNDTNTTINGTETTNNKALKSQNVSTNKEIHVLKSSNNVLQTLANKTNKTDIVFQTSNQKVIMNPQIVYQVPMIVDADNKINQPFINREYPKFVAQNKKDFPKSLDSSKPSDKLFIACPYQMDSKLQPKIVITNIRPKITKVEEVSSLDIYEKRRRMRRLKYLSNRETKETQKPDIKRIPEKSDSLKNIITPDKMKGEIYKEFTNTKISIEEDSSDSDSDYGENELKEYNAIIDEFSKPSEVDTAAGKIEFLANFRLATQDAYKEKQLDREERSLSRDAVAAAYITAGRLDRLCRDEASEPPEQPAAAAAPPGGPEERQSAQKQTFLTELRLAQVPPKYKEGYEKAWQVILKERKRRNGAKQEAPTKKSRSHNEVDLDPDGQLQLLTEIKKSVNENNNLIKKRLDSSCDDAEGDIHALAERNFSELDRLSKMADRSVKLYSGVDSRKRDLNPGFDSENIQKPPKLEQPYHNYPKINIPNISKIISLKSAQELTAGTSSPATSMDEPAGSARGGAAGPREAACQADEPGWPGVEALMRDYKEFEAARKKEISSLHRRNTRLRVDCAQTTRAAAAEAERARALLAERRQLAREEAAARAAILRLARAADAVRGSS